MAEKWFQFSEESAGNKRLLLSYWAYKIFGSSVLRVIAFFVSLSVFLTASKRRRASEKLYKLLKKPPFITALIQFLNYGNALVDKFVSVVGDFDANKIIIDDIEIYNGAFFITSHIGNIEILRSLINEYKDIHINIFLQANACKIFNEFLKRIETKVNADIFPVEEISPETSILISERLKAGEIVFMAGDRVSAQSSNTVYEADFLEKKINLPLGTLKFALLMDVPIYFIVCVKDGEKYRVLTRKFENYNQSKKITLENLKKEYAEFFEEVTMKYPYQFYHFYDIFDNQ